MREEEDQTVNDLDVQRAKRAQERSEFGDEVIVLIDDKLRDMETEDGFSDARSMGDPENEAM